MTFDPKKHLTNLKGKQYLEVKWRLVWFKEEHPTGSISTEVIHVEPLIVRATICNGDGLKLATGHGSAQVKVGAVWSGREVEKAETAAIGRALAHAGYGTQFTVEGDRDNLADSPVERRQQSQQRPQSTRPTPPPAANVTAFPPPPGADPNAGAPSSSASTDAGAQAGGASPERIVVTNPADAFGSQFPVSSRNEAKPDDLYREVATLFNARTHFDNWCSKYAGDLAGKTLEEAVRFAKFVRWNWDKAQVQEVFNFAQNEFEMQTKEVMDALETANEKPLKAVRDYDYGNRDTAVAALWAYHAGYDPNALYRYVVEGKLEEPVRVAAQAICERYHVRKSA